MSLVVTDIVTFKMSSASKDIGEIKFGLFGETVPKTVENFVKLSTGECGFGYANSKVYRIVKDFVCQAGDFMKGDGTGGKSIWGGKFEDENFDIKHTGAGFLSMANGEYSFITLMNFMRIILGGPNTNSSQFFILSQKKESLDGKHVVFGKIISGMKVFREIENVKVKREKPVKPVKIVSCSHETVTEPFTVTESDATD